MLNFLKKNEVKLTLQIVACLLFGILFCAMPQTMMGTIEIIVSLVFLIVGSVILIGYCFGAAINIVVVFVSFVAAFLGIMMLVYPKIFVVIVGLLFIAGGIYNIISWAKCKNKQERKILTIVIGIILVVLGLAVVILNQFSITIKILMIFIGSTLILFGILELIILLCNLHKNKKVNNLSQVETEKSNEKEEKTENLNLNEKEEKTENLNLNEKADKNKNDELNNQKDSNETK